MKDSFRRSSRCSRRRSPLQPSHSHTITPLDTNTPTHMCKLSSECVSNMQIITALSQLGGLRVQRRGQEFSMLPHSPKTFTHTFVCDTALLFQACVLTALLYFTSLLFPGLDYGEAVQFPSVLSLT